MQYFAWGINKPDVKDQRTAIIKTHWDFIAQYSDQLIVRGPVMRPDDFSVVTGSIHIADLPDQAALNRFVYDEPFASAGLFEEIIVARFELELGRTQFEFTSTPDSPRFFVYCPAQVGTTSKRDTLKPAHETYCQKFDEHFVSRGSLLSDEGEWLGSLFFLEMPDRTAVDAFLKDEPYSQADLFSDVQIHRWTMGGPENLNAAGALS
ncbi:MAG: hypothetical protein HOG95_03575 [Rhodospirillaceae bacterium]|nr:hypothetical protein [Rhodospirillaceae bacterium]MBT5938984.1 hypothetical protein [Rhodospirillaceae bacterium]MBT7267957.1 hypothetical protein [Rhodospirillaceae bacterium]